MIVEFKICANAARIASPLLYINTIPAEGILALLVGFAFPD